MRVIKRGFTIVVSIVLWLVILLAALFAFTTLATKDQAHVASLAGYTPMMVQTDSMAPTFLSGDLIFIRKCDTANLEEGDIICFHTIIENEYALNTHRILQIDEINGIRSYVTKGDNNEISDSHIISDGDIVGKYIGKISRLGTVMEFLSSSFGFLVVIVLPMLLFFIYQVYHLIMVTISLRKAIAAEEAAKKAEAQAESTEGRRNQMQEAENRPVSDDETEAILAEARRIRAEAEAAKARAEAEAELAEAKRLKAEAEEQLAKVKAARKED